MTRPEPSGESPPVACSSISRDLVVCLHGLGRTRHCWWLLRRRLQRAGYRTDAWTYPSLGRAIEELSRDCRRRLAEYDADPGVRRLHVVTHSLGGIVLRHALSVPGDRLSKLGVVILLAPPNHGSAWARRLGPWLGWLAPALPQLSDAPHSFVNRLAGPEPQPSRTPADTREDPGRLAARTGAGPEPISIPPRIVVIAGAKDGKCPPATTHLQGQSAHIMVPGRHTMIMYRRDVARAILGSIGGGPVEL